jgi:hypothetical protein
LFPKRSGKGARRRHLESDLSRFFPSSANFWLYPELTYSAANNFPQQLLTLLRQERGTDQPAAMDAETFNNSAPFEPLAELFEKHGSDKASHGYASVYARVLREIGHDVDLLEIGLGTNRPAAVSTMGASGKPGASLRAFRDFLPQARIYGADVDRSILFTEPRIRTAFVDQTALATFDAMTATLGCEAFDLIIDDGLHSSEANLNTTIFGLRALKNGGWLVIEDIPERTLAVWQVVASLLAGLPLACVLIKCRSAHVFAIKKQG